MSIRKADDVRTLITAFRKFACHGDPTCGPAGSEMFHVKHNGTECLIVCVWRSTMFHVKHNEADTTVQGRDVERALIAAGVIASQDQIRRLARHANLVLLANKTTNLTRIVEPTAVAALHVADSLAFTTRVTLSGKIVDIGAGAGFPGIPLAILGHEVWLCESAKKKAAFLRACVVDLGLDSQIHAVRAEELARENPASADIVVARAVSSLASLVELAAPLLVKGGRLMALKGAPADSEREAGLVAARICGIELDSEIRYTLPGGESRSVFVYSRSGRSGVRLPRSPGMAQRHPLTRIQA